MSLRKFWCVLLAAILSTAAAADGGPRADARGAEIYLRGLALQDQDGRTVDLYRDLIAGRSVVIHTFFAGCGDSCPAMMATLKAVQERLGSRLGSEVRLVSITIDPLRDTPAALKAYAGKMGAQPGWVFLTGSEQQVGVALRRLGLFVDDPAAHMDIMVAGNMRTGLWKKIHGTAAGSRVVDLIMGVADDGGR
jgi:protein SCO1/2